MVVKIENQLKLKVISSTLLYDSDRNLVLSLCNRAYEEDFGPLFNTLHPATHILGYYKQTLVTHAMWVDRFLQTGKNLPMHTAYIEMVATAKAYRNRGFATLVMKRLADEIRDFDLGALSPFSVAYYKSLGWQLWEGPLFVRIGSGVIHTPQEEVMIFRLPQTPKLDLNEALSAEWREGELW